MQSQERVRARGNQQVADEVRQQIDHELLSAHGPGKAETDAEEQERPEHARETGRVATACIVRQFGREHGSVPSRSTKQIDDRIQERRALLRGNLGWLQRVDRYSCLQV